MAEYIEREAAKRAFFSGHEFVYYGTDVYERIDALPAADVRPVVLCRNCKHSVHDWEGKLYCGLVKTYNTVYDDWFCADGELLTNCGEDEREVEHEA